MSGLDNGLYHRLDIIRFIPSMWGGDKKAAYLAA
ncbi:hypothetical protein [Salmonella phage P22]|uniref:Uncharacterized protein ORF25 n=1 Tax=Salmonella phage P22 TaxID=10754 RepID=A8CGF8_BPP22|nr:hypothetical protein [Salmonella phage P22]BAG12667.1 hypothetical protein [Salmonella phage P22]